MISLKNLTSIEQTISIHLRWSVWMKVWVAGTDKETIGSTTVSLNMLQLTESPKMAVRSRMLRVEWAESSCDSSFWRALICRVQMKSSLGTTIRACFMAQMCWSMLCHLGLDRIGLCAPIHILLLVELRRNCSTMASVSLDSWWRPHHLGTPNLFKKCRASEPRRFCCPSVKCNRK